MRRNKITKRGIETIGANNKGIIQILGFSGTQLTPEALNSVVKSFPNLVSLDISHNELGDSIQPLEQMSFLSALNLRRTCLSNKSIIHLN